jgi:NIMA (never in mitosis gene a)-related kinase 9
LLSILKASIGNNSSHAKLGHGKSAGFTRIPKRVESFDGITLQDVSCGEDFTCCISENGELFTFGVNYSGCLGLGVLNEQSNRTNESSLLDQDTCVYIPTRVSYFVDRRLKVVKVACGDNHVIVLTDTNQVFTWGSGEYGRLGHGDETDCHEPTELKFRFKYAFKDVFAGLDNSFLLTKEGRVLAFGNQLNSTF